MYLCKPHKKPEEARMDQHEIRDQAKFIFLETWKGMENLDDVETVERFENRFPFEIY